MHFLGHGDVSSLVPPCISVAVLQVCQTWMPAQVPVLLRSLTSKLPLPDIPHGTEGLIETIWLLMTSVVAVPAICALPGGSPVLGFLVRYLHLCQLSGLCIVLVNMA